jgi:hypothetical protein
MNEVYIGFSAFLVTAALIVWGYYFATSKEGEMTIFNKRRVQPQTRIVHIDKIQDTAPAQVLARSVVQTPRWDVRCEQFQGFDSPPGRF